MSIVEDILAKIKEYNVITIHGHKRPDGDCYGCQFGLKNIIKTSFPEKEVYVVGEVCNYVTWLGTPDEIDDEKFKGALAICVDCGNAERLSDQRYTLADYVIKIDHHIPVDQYGDIQFVEDEKPACAQMIFEIFDAHRDELKITKEGAVALYTGILTDTGRFRYDSVAPSTFRAAAKLLELGVDIVDIDNKLSVETLDVIKFKGYVLSNFQMTPEGFAYIVVKKEVIEEFGVAMEDAANQVNLISTIPGYPVWALIIEYPAEIRIRLRSRGPNVDLLANQYGGGGHAKAAGAKLESWEQLPQFVSDASKIAKEYNESL